MKAVIIDDEPNSRELLEVMLQEYCEGVDLRGCASDVESGCCLIAEHQPDVVLLDIEMPGENGFSLLTKFPNPSFRLIFVTGYNSSFVKQVVRTGLNYLEKPVNLPELQRVLGVAAAQLPVQAAQIEMLAGEKEKQGLQKEVLLPHGNQLERVTTSEIVCVEAHRAYALFKLVNGDARLTSYSLGHWESVLPTEQFCRVHRTYLLNLDEVRSYQTGRGGSIVLQNGMEVPVSVRRKATFVGALDRWRERKK